jgi:hypothetical protein
MKRLGTSALVALAAAALMTTTIPAHAANPTRVAAKAAGPAKHSARTPTRSEKKKSSEPAPATAPPASATRTTSATSSVICFQSSVRCFAAVRAPGTSQSTAMDLHPPDVRKVFPLAELQKRLPDADDEREAQEAATVQVSTERVGPPPEVPIGILAPFWAIRHPTQAWRIFLPVPEAK